MNSKIFIIPFLLMTWFVGLSAKDVIRPITQEIPPITNPTMRAGNELSMLENLIDVTKQNLESLKDLKVLVADYIQLQEKYSKNTQNEQLSFQMVTKAHQVLEKIKEQHLTQAFDQEFLSELTFFSNIASKWQHAQ